MDDSPSGIGDADINKLTLIIFHFFQGSDLGTVTTVFKIVTCVLYDKLCVISGKCMLIIVKTKRVNSGNLSDICGKLNFTDTNFIINHLYLLS